MILTGLPNTSPRRKAAMFRTVNGALVILRKGLAGTAASDNGAINVWKDRRGRWRGARCVFLRDVSACECTSIVELAAWLKVELPKIQ